MGNGKIKSVSIYAGEVESCFIIGQQFVDEIKRESLYIDGDAYEHFVVYMRGEVKATVRCLFAHEVIYEVLS